MEITKEIRKKIINYKKKKSFGKGANRGGILGNRVVLPEDYSPNNDEEFMNDKQLEFFRQKLTNWKLDLLGEAQTQSYPLCLSVCFLWPVVINPSMSNGYS
jgi:hypothetical protein